jgi:phosphate/sulfate permease
LIGGLVGAGIAKVGLSAIVWAGLGKTTAAIVLSPLIGFFLALLLVLPCARWFRTRGRSWRRSRKDTQQIRARSPATSARRT